MSVLAIIHQRIKERRNALGLTLAQLADSTGVKEATAQRWESGVIKTIRYDTIELLSEVLKCSPQYLMGWDNNLTPAPSQPALAEEEARLVADYRRLAPEGKSAVQDFVDYAKTRYPVSQEPPSQERVG